MRLIGAGSSMADPSELRKLADWYRAFAEVSSGGREDWLNFAAYLERKAEELERQATDISPCPPSGDD